MKKKKKSILTMTRSFAMAFSFILSLLIPKNFVFAADGSYFIGTVTDSNNDMQLTQGNGYVFYTDAECTVPLGGSQEITEAKSIYLKANENYVIWNVKIMGTDGSAGVGIVTKGEEIYQLSFPQTATANQKITVTTAVNASGGTINTTSSSTEVAAMFNNVASGVTDNVTVEKAGNTYTVTVKNNILLNDTIVIGAGVSLNILSAGNNIIKRGTCTTGLFSVSESSSSLTLGSGSILYDTVTYIFDDHSTVTQNISDDLPASEDHHIVQVQVNSQITSTMAGTLTIDGGADLNTYTGTAYSYKEASDSSTSNLIRVINGGRVSMWGGVTLQNNIVNGNDQDGGTAINIKNSTLTMYGGVIKNCSNCSTSFPGYPSSSMGDGGALFISGTDAKAYIYGGEIKNCEADNSSAISLWDSSKLYMMDGIIHQNFSVGDVTYPAQAISAYNNAVLYMFGGTISDNQGVNSQADVRISSTGSNILHLFGGTIGSIGSNAETNKVYIYSGQVNQMMGLTEDSPMAGEIIYTGGFTQYRVTLPDAVNGDGSQNVRIKVSSGSTEIESFSTGTGSPSLFENDLVMLLPNGSYTIEVTSTSMKKTYAVVVNESDVTANATGREMTAPVLINQTQSGVTLKEAGTGNSSTDGNFLYGFTAGSPGTPTNWQTERTFSGFSSGTFYFYVKAASVTGSFSEHCCTTPLTVTFTANPTISIGETITLAKGGITTITPVISTPGYPVNSITWEILGSSPDSTITVNANGSCTVIVSMNETRQEIVIKASLAEGNFDTVVIMVGVNTPIICPVQGKALSKITTGAASTITVGKEFSFYTQFSYSQGNQVRLVSSNAIPIGSRITLIDLTDERNPKYFYHNVTESDFTLMTPASFIEMGGYNCCPFDSNISTFKAQFTFSLPSALTTKFTFQSYLSDSEVDVVSLQVNGQNPIEPSGTAALSLFASNTPETLTATLTSTLINVPMYRQSVAVIELLDEDSNPIHFPNMSKVFIGAEKAVIRGNIAYANWTNSTNITINNLPEGESYRLRASICLLRSGSFSPMNSVVASTGETAPVTVSSASKYCMRAVKISGNRLIHQTALQNSSLTLAFRVDYTMSGPVSANLQISVDKVSPVLQTNREGFIVTGSITDLPSSLSVASRTLNLLIPQSAEAGTYRINFSLGTAYYSYSFIIK